MAIYVRIVSILFLLMVAVFCVFGFMATYEPPAEAHWPFRVAYGMVGIGCLTAAAWLGRQTGARNL